MLVRLNDPAEKGLIYKYTKNLKNITNSDGEGYYVNDQLPDVLEEQKRKRKQKVKINKTLIDAQQQTLQWKKGELLVEGEIYKQKIDEPTGADILEMSSQDISRILKLKLQGGDEFHKNGSTFKAFAMKVHSIQQVADGYRQMKYRFMNSTHIICSYRIMDPDVAHMTDCIDGGEVGAGRRLIDMMMQESFENIAVYVVRHHRGPNIGPIRFEMILNAAKTAINAIPATLSAMLTDINTPRVPFYSQHMRFEQERSDPQNTVIRRSHRGGRFRTQSNAARSLPFSHKSPARPGGIPSLRQSEACTIDV